MPRMLKAEEPVNVTGAQLTYDSAQGRAVFVGNARLWQAESSVQGDHLTLDDARGDLTVRGNARSVMLLAQNVERIDEATTQKTVVREKVRTIATAQDLVYEDALRRATYTTNAHAVGAQGDLVADRIEFYLDETGEALERAEAYTAVTLRQAPRTATGARLTYFAATERYLMTGDPVKIVEDLAQECRETTGRTLTFFKSTDTITVDGERRIRTHTKSAGPCPAA
jgi:lipopolysaccharide export system protein LptA